MGKKVGIYELEKKIGEGNYGTVFLGKNSESQEVIAGKSIPIKNPNKKLLQQMDTEIRVLKDSNCPYIIKLHDVLKTQNNIYLIMEYCGGGDLENYVKTHGKVEENIAKRWLSQLVESFIYLQEKHIMHRDIKLANILLTVEDDSISEIRVADFGFARFLDENSFAATQLGTPLFMAPEIFNNENYSFKADVWSLGVLAYEILTGAPVFVCRTLAQLKKMQQEEIKFPETLSDQARLLIKDLLSYDHKQRPSFQQLRGHAFFTSIYNLPEIPSGSIAASPEIQMDNEEDDYEFPGNESPEVILIEDKEEREDEDELPLVKIEENFGVLAGKTMDIDCKVEHFSEVFRFHSKVPSPIVAHSLLKYSNAKFAILYKEAGNVAAEYSLTRSKDILFSDLYEKIQSFLFETADMLDKVVKIGCTDEELFEAFENEAKRSNGNLEEVKQSLIVLEVAVDLPDCPESIKQLQHELLLAHKDFLRRGYY